jgi:predicted TIM-barrel fold metal-dependent hydrolase
MDKAHLQERWPVIDTHFHIGVNLINTFVAETELIPFLDKHGIDIQVVFQVNEGFQHKTPSWNPYVGNDYIAKIQNMFPDRVIGLATINPWLQAPKTYNYPPQNYGQKMDLPIKNEALEELDRCILELGLRGLKMHPLEHNYEINNPTVVYPLLQRLSELQKICGKKLFIVVHGAGDSVNNTATAIAETAKAFPDLLFLMAHAGFIWCYGTVSSVSIAVPNLMLDLTLTVGPYCVKEAYDACGATKFTIGTDGPFDLPQIKEPIVRALVGDDDEAWQLIMGGNLAKYLGIPKIKVK